MAKSKRYEKTEEKPIEQTTATPEPVAEVVSTPAPEVQRAPITPQKVIINDRIG